MRGLAWRQLLVECGTVVQGGERRGGNGRGGRGCKNMVSQQKGTAQVSALENQLPGRECGKVKRVASKCGAPQPTKLHRQAATHNGYISECKSEMKFSTKGRHLEDKP